MLTCNVSYSMIVRFVFIVTVEVRNVCVQLHFHPVSFKSLEHFSYGST